MAACAPLTAICTSQTEELNEPPLLTSGSAATRILKKTFVPSVAQYVDASEPSGVPLQTSLYAGLLSPPTSAMSRHCSKMTNGPAS